MNRLFSMSGRVKHRGATNNPVDMATTTVNERILKECHELYMDPDNGLIKSAQVHIRNTLEP